MQLKRFFGEHKDNSFHPSWILIIVALTILIGSVVWIIATLAPNGFNQQEQLPSLSPTGARTILVVNTGFSPDPPHTIL